MTTDGKRRCEWGRMRGSRRFGSRPVPILLKEKQELTKWREWRSWRGR